MAFFSFLAKVKDDNKNIKLILYDGKWYIGYVNEWYDKWLMTKPIQIDFQENGLVAHKLFIRLNDIEFPSSVVKAEPTEDMIKLYEAIVNGKEDNLKEKEG